MQEQKRSVIPPQSGHSFRLKRGELARVIDPEGQQVADMWAFTANGDGLDWLSTSQTRDITERLFPRAGECFYSEKGHPLLTLVEDNSPGPHDMLFPPCDTALYARAGLHDHPNCYDNFLGALREAGMTVPFVPNPVNLFQNSPPQPDGRLEVLASRNPPGGNVLLRAEADILLVVTACSVDYHPTNGEKCTEIIIEIDG